MPSGAGYRDIDYHSPTLPRGTFARSLFDSHLVRLSDRGGASQLIGAAWSDVVSDELNAWSGESVPGVARLAHAIVREVHRLDTLPGVAMRASRAGLKNPDFIVVSKRDERQVVFAVDAKFSVETARPAQVSAETTGQLFEADEHLTGLLPDIEPDPVYIDGVFLSPDYSLTHAMFRHRIGHRRLTVSERDVVLATVKPRNLFADVAELDMIERLSGMDDLAFDVWGSLLASQYYFRLERAVVGLVADERKPLLGDVDGVQTTAEVKGRLEDRARGATSAWQAIVDWDRDVDVIRRQRQAIHQVIGIPLSNAELRDRADRIMAGREMNARPSRNQIRKALGGRFMAEVLDETGPLVPPVANFPAELARIAAIARTVSERYCEDITDILTGIIDRLAARDGTSP